MTRDEAIEVLYECASAKRMHLYDGSCPEGSSTEHFRGPDCVVCQALRVFEGKSMLYQQCETCGIAWWEEEWKVEGEVLACPECERLHRRDMKTAGAPDA